MEVSNLSIFKRVYLYFTRKRGKNILLFTIILFAILLIMATLVLTGLSIWKASEAAQHDLRQSLDGTSDVFVNWNNSPYTVKEDTIEDTGKDTGEEYDEETGKTSTGFLHSNGIQEALNELSEKNPEASAFVDAYTGIEDYNLELDLSSEITVGTIPYLTQWDSRWGYCLYGEGLIGYTGCGPTALSMVAMGLTGDGTLTPAYIADYATRDGYCVPGDGTAWLLFSEGAEKLGLTARELPLSETTMRDELEDGHPIICVMGPGHFTETGHYIVIVSCDNEGFQVYDPNRPSNCKTWSYDEIYGEIRNLWSYCGVKE